MLASASSAPSASAAGTYARREPENTVLHRIVREHLATFLATVCEERGKSLPCYVEEELRRYLRCGILAHGFLRVARAEVCREDDVREVRGLAELILPSQRDAEEGTGGFVLAGSALLGLASR